MVLCVCVCVCVVVLYLILNVCVAGSLQQRLHHASMPSRGRNVQRRPSILQRRGCVATEWCSHAVLLSVPRIKHTDRRSGEEPRDKVYSAQDKNTNIMYMYYLFVLKEAHAGNAKKHKHAHSLLHTLSHTLTHTRMRMKAHKHKREICPQDRKHIKHTYNYIIAKVWLEAHSGSLDLIH